MSYQPCLQLQYESEFGPHVPAFVSSNWKDIEASVRAEEEKHGALEFRVWESTVFGEDEKKLANIVVEFYKSAARTASSPPHPVTGKLPVV